MSEQEKKLSAEEMLKKAEQDWNYKAVEEHLQEIRNRLKAENVNKLSPEQLRSFLEFAKLLKSRKEELNLEINQNKDNTRLALNNLKEEIELNRLIEDELNKMQEIKLNKNAYFDSYENQDEKIILNFYLKRISENNYVISANGKDVNISKKLSNLSEIENFVSEIQSSQYEKLVSDTQKEKNAIEITNKRLEELKSNKNEKIAIATKWTWEKPKEVKDEKKSDKKKKWVSELDKSDVKEQKIELPKEEEDAAKEVFGFDVNKTNFRNALKIIDTKNPTTKEEWESYKYDNNTWLFRDIELEQLSHLVEFKKMNPQVIRNINKYYDSWESIITYLKDKKNLEKNYTSKTVFEYLSNRESRLGLVNESQILTILNKNNWTPEVFKAIKKAIEIGGWKIWDFSNKEELFTQLKKNPGNKLAFIKWIDLIAWGKMDIWYYFEDGWETYRYREAVTKWYEKLNIKLEETFEKKYSDIIKIAKLEAEKLPAEKKKEALEKIKILESLEQKTKLKDFFRLKTISLFGSLVEWKQWWWALIAIGNNSENEIINKIDLELWFFTTAEGKFLPWVGISISDSYEATETINLNWKVGVNIFWVYMLAWADKMVNLDEIKNASFDSFATTSKRVWLSGNMALWFAWWFSYGWGIYYKESMQEWISKKEKQLWELINQFKKIQSITEIDSLKLEWVNEEDSIKIKEDFRNILIWLGFDKEKSQRWRNQIIEMAKEAKLEMFRFVASKIAQDKWWELNWGYLWVQFLAGFFPIPVVGISLEKVSQKFSLNKEKRLQDDVIMMWSMETTQDYEKIAKKVNRRLQTNMKFNNETWLYELEWYDDKTWTIKNLNWKEVAIQYSSEVAKNIKIDWNKLIIWNVQNIIPINRISSEKEENILILGGWNNILEEWSYSKFSSNNPQWFIKKWAEKIDKKEELDILFVSWFREFIDKNIGRFNSWISVYRSRQSKLFIEFSEYLDSWNIEKAKNKMVEFLKLQKKHLKWLNKNETVTKQDIPVEWFIGLLEREQNVQNLSQTLQEFADVLMTDLNTLNRVNNSRKSKSIKESNYQMATTAYFWKWTNRKSAFERMATKEFWENAQIIKNLRQQRVEQDKNIFWWNVDNEVWKDIFAVVASYKIAKDNKDKVHSLGKRFLAMPPGTVSVADWKVLDISWANEDKLFETLFRDSLYKESVKNTIAKTIKKLDNSIDTSKIDDTKLKELILNKGKWIEIDGKKISLPDAKFVMFMYGRCYNEAVWFKTGKIEINIPWEAPKFAPVNFATWGWVDSQNVWMDTKEINLWGAWTGDDKKWDNPSNLNNNTTTPGGTLWNWNTTIPDTWWSWF